MESDNGRELSSLRLERKECPKCGAVWLNGQHTWNTGAKGNELDLASLVCNKLGDANCINPCKGKEGGDTWEKRLTDLHRLEDEAYGDEKL
jgi:hypothetical protein|tara:strand:+ start:254 stop:526 length:273 start_codon:yes stop_codon:yes gene_type:complete